jgi:hypothetical protein
MSALRARGDESSPSIALDDCTITPVPLPTRYSANTAV